MNEIVYVGLGSNLGDRRALLEEAARRLGARRLSTIRETEPVGFVDQPPFLNAVAELEGSLGPSRLLARMQEIERELGRERTVTWGPRTIDLDLLLYGKRRIKTERLVVPHPRMTERRFVLEPLAELAPGVVVPGTRRTVRRLLELVGAMTHA